jgi:hypothetical protein
MADHADRLLAQIRAGVAELQWQLARFVSHHSGGGNLAA